MYKLGTKGAASTGYTADSDLIIPLDVPSRKLQSQLITTLTYSV